MTQDKVWNYASVMDYQKIKLNKLCVCVCVCVCVMCFYTLKKMLFRIICIFLLLL